MGRREVLLSALVLSAWLAAPAAFAQTPPRVDRLPDVVVSALPPPEKADVMANRLARFVNSECFRADAFNPNPTDNFNRAYYAEMTGQADYYEGVKAAMPPKRLRYVYRPPLHTNVFRNLDGPPPVPGMLPIMASGGSDPGPRGCEASAVRKAAEKNTSFGRALALLDKGEYDKALPLLIETYEALGGVGLGSETALIVGKLYLAGAGAPRDPERALVWLKRVMAARKMVKGGNGIRSARYDPNDPDRFYKAVSEAAVLIAGVYASGDGVPADPVQARRWLEIAAAESHVPAVKVLGDYYYDGYGGSVRRAAALVNYNAAGGMLHAGAKFEAAGMYQRGESVKVNNEHALKLYREAAVLGDADAAYALAVAHDRGEGVEADPQKAIGFFKDAALKGHPAAMTALGTYFYRGELIALDLPQARAWFEEAAIRGDADGMFNLAAMQIRGEGGEADPVKAWAWLTLARKGGRQDAAAALATLEARMDAADLAAARALVAPTG